MVSVNQNTKTLSGIISGSFDSADVSSLSVDSLTVSNTSSLGSASCSSCTASGALSSGSLSVSGVSALAGLTCSSCTATGGLTGASLNISGTSTQGAITCTSCSSTGGVDISSGQSYKVNGSSVLSSSALGSGVTTSSLTSVGTQTGGLNVATGQSYKVNGTSVLSATTLGSGVTASSLTSIGTQTGGLDISAGQSYKVNGTSVLSSSTLGSGVTASSLTSVGTLTSLTVSGNVVQSSGTCSLRSPTVTLSGASDVLTIQNTTAHPSISLKGTSTQHGYIGFFDDVGATKGSVYCSSTRNGVVVDMGSMTSGFLVQKSGSTMASVDPSGNVVATGSLTGGTTQTTSIQYSLGEASSISSSVYKFGTSSYSGVYSNRSYLLVKNLSSASIQSSWTFELWFYPTLSRSGYIASLPQNNIFDLYFISGSPNSISLSLSNGTTSILAQSWGTLVTGAISLNTWYNIAVVRNSSTNQYLFFLNGTLTDTVSSSTNFTWGQLSTALTFGSSYGFYSNFSTSTQYAAPSYNNSFTGYIDECRISSTARYSATYTVATGQFSYDANTVFLQHFDNSILEVSQDAPVTTASSMGIDSSGNLTGVSLTTYSGNIATTGGDIVTQQGFVQTGGVFTTTDSKLTIAPKALLTATQPLSATASYGFYITTSGGFSVNAKASHTISPQEYLFGQGNTNTGNYTTNACGKLSIYVTNKASSGVGKTGLAEVFVQTQYGNLNVDLQVMSIAKYNLTTFSVSYSYTTIKVTVESDCYLAWKYEGAI